MVRGMNGQRMEGRIQEEGEIRQRDDTRRVKELVIAQGEMEG